MYIENFNVYQNFVNIYNVITNDGENLLFTNAVDCGFLGTLKDRRLFTHHMSLEPVTCGPFW